jgi:hypothetical protein
MIRVLKLRIMRRVGQIAYGEKRRLHAKSLYENLKEKDH